MYGAARVSQFTPHRSRSSSSGSSRQHWHHQHHHRSAEPVEAGPRQWVTFDGVAEGLLYANFAFAPLAFGVVAAWSREVWLMLVAAAAVTVAAKHVAAAVRGRPAGFRWTWAYPVMAAFLGLCVLQLVPLPAAWVSAVQPRTVGLRAELLADLPDAAGLVRRVTVSFYPHATVGESVLLGGVVVLFCAVLDVFRTPARIRRLLSAVATVGLVVAAIAGYENLTGATTIYGTVQAAHRNAGPFMNYSHFSQFMNLSVGAALALVLDRVAELGEFYRTPAEVWAALRQPRHAAVWAWAALCVAGPLVVLLSLSRMGMISLGVATVVTGGMLVWRGRAAGGGRGWIVVGLGLAVFVVLLGVGLDVVANRLGSLRDLRASGGGRQEMLRDMTAEFRQFPVVGTGLGTHAFVFPEFDRRDVASLADHADDDYAQLLEETGAVGVGLAGAFLAGLAVSYVRATLHPVAAIDYVPFGLGFGLVAILVHSATDFGQHIPADAALTATFAALLTTFARYRPAEDAGAEPAAVVDPAEVRVVRRVRWRSVPLAGGVAAATVAGAVAVGLWADRARAAESHWSDAQARADDLAAKSWQGADAAYADLLAPAAAALAAEPGDVQYRYGNDTYRYQSKFHTVDPKTGKDVIPPGGEPVAAGIVADLDAIRVSCPTFGPPECVAGQIDRDVLGRPARGEAEIAAGYRLAPYNPTICLIAGLDAVDGHRDAEAIAILTRYLKLGGQPADFDDYCIARGAALVAYRVVQHDHERLLGLADRMPAADPRWRPWIDKCRSAAADLLAADAAKPDATPLTVAERAEAVADQGRPAEAADLFRRALSADYGNTGWRLMRARCLLAAGRPAEAAREARLCLQLRPDLADARAVAAEGDAAAATRPSPSAP